MNELSVELKKQIFGQFGDDPILTLLTISHPSFAGPIRLVNNTEDIVSRGETFIAFPFKMKLSDDDGETSKEVSISLDNVSLEIIGDLRNIVTPPDVSLEVILSSDPDEVQISYEELKMRDISYNQSTIEAKLYLDSFLTVSVPPERYTPTSYRGIFE